MKKNTVRVYDTVSKNMLMLRSVRRYGYITTERSGILMITINRSITMKFSFQR